MAKEKIKLINTKTSSAYPGSGVIITLDKSDSDAMNYLSWFYPGMEIYSEINDIKGIINTVDRQGHTFTVIPNQPDAVFQGSEPYKFKANDEFYFLENKIGNFIWQLNNYDGLELNDGTTIPIASNSTQWVTDTPIAAYPQYNIANLIDYGILYNAFALESLKVPGGWRVPLQSDMQDLCSTAGNAPVIYPPVSYPPFVQAGKLRQTGTTYWLSGTGAQNFENFNARGAGNINSVGASVNFKTYAFYYFTTQKNMAGYISTLSIGAPSVLWLFSGSNFSGFWRSLSKRTGASVRLCRDYQENVVITK